MMKIQNPTSYGSDILINTSLKNEMVVLMNEVKSFSSNTDYLLLMNNLIADVNYFENKTVNTILTDF